MMLFFTAVSPVWGILVACTRCTYFELFFSPQIWTANIHDCIQTNLEPIMGASYHTYHHLYYNCNCKCAPCSRGPPVIRIKCIYVGLFQMQMVNFSFSGTGSMERYVCHTAVVGTDLMDRRTRENERKNCSAEPRVPFLTLPLLALRINDHLP